MQLELRGNGGMTLVVSDDVIRIEKKGLLGGKKREKAFPIRNISSVEVKKPAFWPGFIQLSIAGGHARNSSFSLTGGWYAAQQDENSVCFAGKDRYAEALEVKSYIEEWSTRHEQQSVTSHPASMEPVSVADEILKLKSLANDGILTAEEFEAQKKELLGPKTSAESQNLDHHRQGDEKVNPSVEIHQENEEQGGDKAGISFWKWMTEGQKKKEGDKLPAWLYGIPGWVSLLIVSLAVVLVVVSVNLTPAAPTPELQTTATPETLSAAEHLKSLVMCNGVTVLASMYWGQAPGLAYAGDPTTSGQLQEGDVIRFLMGEPNENGEVRVKVFPHDGRAVGKSDDQVWINWETLTGHRLDLYAFRCQS